MKTIYTYHFTANGTFTCTVENKEKKFSLKEEKAIESLKLLDTVPFSRLQVYKHSVHLQVENAEIHLRDLDLFAENQLDANIPQMYKKIEVAMKNYLREEAKKKTKKNRSSGTKTIVKATMGAILTATLLASIKLNAEADKVIQTNVTVVDIPTWEALPKEDIDSSNIDEKTETTEEIVLEENTEETNLTLENNTDSSKNIESVQNQENVVYLNYRKTDDLAKKEYSFKTHKELANWCGEKWGMSPNLILMQATQESGGMEENLMQIVWEKWASDEPIRAYNFRDSKYETFLLKNNPTEEEKAKYTCITEEDLKNPKTNMSIGCVLLRKSAEYMDYHIMAALQCYNLGYGNMDAVFQKMEAETGQTRDEILSDQTNLSFYDYTYVPGEGDPYYLSHIFQFIDEYGDEITFKHLQNGEVVEERIRIFNQAQSL